MILYALIGWPLGHSFSKKYFSEKFTREGIADVAYELFPLAQIAELPALLAQHPNLRGLNVTIPHKEAVIPYLDELDDTARAVGAVNCIKITRDKRLIGYNTDVIGFEQSLVGIPGVLNGDGTVQLEKACILGTGGAAKAVGYVLNKLGIPFRFVSRAPAGPDQIGYADMPGFAQSSRAAIINCTPLGTYPKVDEMPPVPKEIFTSGNLVYDLVYNPAETLLLREAIARGCTVQNGLDMLHLQAAAAWIIWQIEP